MSSRLQLQGNCRAAVLGTGSFARKRQRVKRRSARERPVQTSSTAAAEAMSMFLGQRKGVKKKNAFTFFVSELCHPQTIEVLKTRANPIRVNIEVGDHNSLDVTDPELYGMLLQYPATDGSVENYSPEFGTKFVNCWSELKTTRHDKTKNNTTLLVIANYLLSLCSD